MSTAAANTTGGSRAGSNVYVPLRKLISLIFVKSSEAPYLLD